MKIHRYIINSTLFVLVLITIPVAFNDVIARDVSKPTNCQLDNPQLQSMGESSVTFTREDGSLFVQKVRVADSNETRAAGFQRVCASTIAARPILFLYMNAVTPRFHMNNVVAPIEIAFIDHQGAIDSIQIMRPYVLGSLKKPLYQPNKAVLAALETYVGFFADNKLDLQSRVDWSAPISPAVKILEEKPGIDGAHLFE